MRTTDREALPKASHPPSTSTIAINSLEAPEFPFKRVSALPHFSYAIENLIMSIATIITAFADCILTLYVWIPLGIARSLLQNVVEPLLRILTKSQGEAVHPSTEQGAARVIVLSGASSGIGASLVQTYAGPNTILVLLARNPARLNQIAKIARNAGCRAVETHSIDYSHDGAENSIRQVIQSAHKRYGSIDLVLSVTGTVTFTDDDPRGPEQWGENTVKRLTKINVTSTNTFIMTAWELMKKQRSGSICIISSSVAFQGPPQFAVYAATKANLLSFAQSLRSLSTPYGIRVSCICPGFIESGMTGDMLAAGSSMPGFGLADSNQMAQRIKDAVDGEQAGVIWPISHVLPLVMASRLNWLNGDLARWVASKVGVTGQMVS
ncbi:hypothetical protein MJO28_007537 [Puccinia striiformis f. sp. tritici]|uniref:Uncharacterized protein n=2 Tax=Puccinia striiformis f. sp. tritici TaxID=168172 RepID=A0A0L0VSI8_9BASI|nr:hypothetical protein Pst134EA_013638 [Puccinia striiformis f. sp. tritici]KAI9628140.1 hypothetical protein H4Q26_018181 [Puccinia striiformis f. sp. tritici PST-130]KNF02177.1 hypothetical protein PSTG_04674 [Puccinia striiformis f. sp. tritici PST-78]KAH9454540.1 hypothetical protein Pst134EB_014613 [Puccinia striiformis f. sp. tritici]KAH9465771.1 hypothetical protein Pst134EA_013638 [Puccinia striiformis f. sp. tritici]KAI7951853.1 hypothetical protein MJO28_007537 [Puccinia striiformis